MEKKQVSLHTWNKATNHNDGWRIDREKRWIFFNSKSIKSIKRLKKPNLTSTSEKCSPLQLLGQGETYSQVHNFFYKKEIISLLEEWTHSGFLFHQKKIQSEFDSPEVGLTLRTLDETMGLDILLKSPKWWREVEGKGRGKISILGSATLVFCCGWREVKYMSTGNLECLWDAILKLTDDRIKSSEVMNRKEKKREYNR